MMENLVWIIYFIDTILGNSFVIGTGFFIVISLLAAVLVALLVCISIAAFDLKESHVSEYIKSFRPKIKYYFYLLGVIYVLNIAGDLLPSKDTAYKMLAAYGVTEIAQNEDVQKLGGKSLEVLNQAMDEYLKKGEEK